MVAVFAWLDNSEHDRRRALDVIDLFRQKETVDELGLGSIRDTVADVLTPGTSTIQTRARYFFFIPWAYLALERRAEQSDRVTARARKLEVDLIAALKSGPDRRGTIGIDAGPALRRMPSQVYWAGLGRLCFRLFPGSQDQYHRALERGDKAAARDDTGDRRIDAALPGNWHPHLPPAPAGFPRSATFDLTKVEAEFFRDQLRLHAPDSLVAFLVDRGETVQGLDLPWRHAEIAAMPSQLQQWLRDAQNFSELLHGAQLLYNLMLAEAKKAEEWVADYRERLSQWADEVDRRRTLYADWDRPGFWQRLTTANPRLPAGARRFAEKWIETVLARSPASGLLDDRSTRALLDGREQQLKGPRARLHSPAHLALWGGDSGSAVLTYRWRITQDLVGDIVAGLDR